MVSLLGQWNFKFPQPVPLTKTMADYLEDEVDEKYYINSEKAQKLIQQLMDSGQLSGCVGNVNPSGNGINGNVFSSAGLAPTFTTNKGEGPKILDEVKQLGNYEITGTWDNPQTGRVYSTEGLSPTLNTCGGGSHEPKILDSKIKMFDIPQTVSIRKYDVNIDGLKACLRTHKKLTNKAIADKLTKPVTLVEHWFRNDNSFSIPDADIWYQLKKLLGVTTDEFDLSITEFVEQDGVYEKANRCYMVDGIAPTITSASADEKILVSQYRIRKLTPLECWRLMDYTDEDFHKAESVNSNTQLYKEAGNGIVKAVLMAIFLQMIPNTQGGD
jgi:DNA (cytosine-5)-methyltransferase 1